MTEKFNYSISLTSSQTKNVEEWQREQDAKVALKQKSGFAYYGAHSGGYSWVVTPTSVGTVIEVENTITRERLDLTDYSSW